MSRWRRTGSWHVLFLIGWSALACAPPDVRPWKLDARDWRVAQVGSIQVLTNTDPEIAERHLRKLSRFLQLAEIVGDHRLPPYPIKLHLFDSIRDYAHYTGGVTAGHVIPGFGTFYISLTTDFPEHTTSTLFHEVVHLLLMNNPGEQFPVWFHEGYAEYLSSAVLRPGVASLGRVLPIRSESMRQHGKTTLREMLRTRTPLSLPMNRMLSYYADSWGFVHFAMTSANASTLEPQLRAFVRALSNGESVNQAFPKAFGMSIEAMQLRYDRHRTRLYNDSDVLYRHYAIDDSATPIQFEEVSPAEVHLDLGEHAFTLERPRQAATHFAGALSERVGWDRALFGLAISQAAAGDLEAASKTAEKIEASSRYRPRALGAVELTHYFLATQPRPEPSSTGSAEEPDPDSLTDEEKHELLRRGHVHFLDAVESDPGCGRCWFGISAYHAYHPDGDATIGLDAVDKAGDMFGGGIEYVALLIKAGRKEEALAAAYHQIATSHNPEHVRKLIELVRAVRRSSLYERNR